jgi:hypothetical protein
MMSSSSAAYRWSSCEITWKNLVLSLLMPAKKNCASAWANHTAGRSPQNGGSRTATLDASAGDELSAGSMLCRGHQCGMSMHFETTTSTITTVRLLTAQMRLMALKRAVFARPKMSENSCRRRLTYRQRLGSCRSDDASCGGWQVR